MTPNEIVQQAEKLLKFCQTYSAFVIEGKEVKPVLEYLLAERKAMKETLAQHVHCGECNAVLSLNGMYVTLQQDTKPPFFCTFECIEKHLEKHPELHNH